MLEVFDKCLLAAWQGAARCLRPPDKVQSGVIFDISAVLYSESTLKNGRVDNSRTVRRAGMPSAQSELKIKRVYAPSSPSDGARILVDRLWPRGISKGRAAITLWMKDIAPSPELREWFHLDIPTNWKEFQRRYTAELRKNPEAVSEMMRLIDSGPVTLVYGAHDDVRNHARVLLAFLDKRLPNHPADHRRKA